MARVKIVAAALLVLAALRGTAHEQQQGNANNLGSVEFATSCDEAAQKEFNRSVALLHSFQFSRAIAGFNAALTADPRCAIAYWGIALSDWSNPFATGQKDSRQLQLGRDSVRRGMSIGAGTERERAYLMAVAELYADVETTPQSKRFIAYRNAMENVAAKYPEDREAEIFYALALAAPEDPAQVSS